MSFSMSGGGWEYNRFDEFEKALSEGAKGYQEGGEVVADCEDGTCGKCSKCKKKKEGKKSSSAKPDYLDVDKDGDKEEDMKDAIEDNGGAVSEGIDFKGAKRIDDAREKAQAEKDKKSPSSKNRRLAMGKFRPGASAEERADGGRDSMREKGTSPTKNGKKMFEDAYAAVYGEGYEPINQEKQAKIDRQIGRSADKEAIEQGKSKKYGRDEKKIDKEYQRQQAMRFQKKMKKEETELFSADELAAIAEVLGEGLSVLDQMKVSKEYFAKRNARSDEEKAAEKKAEAQSRAKTSAMHKQPDPYKARAGESD